MLQWAASLSCQQLARSVIMLDNGLLEKMEQHFPYASYIGRRPAGPSRLVQGTSLDCQENSSKLSGSSLSGQSAFNEMAGIFAKLAALVMAAMAAKI